jgi:hypothetical protein
LGHFFVVVIEMQKITHPLFLYGFNRQVAGAGVDVTPLQARWDKFDLMLDSHALMIKEQVGRSTARVGESRVFGDCTPSSIFQNNR